jgi:hypothetical protein
LPTSPSALHHPIDAGGSLAVPRPPCRSLGVHERRGSNSGPHPPSRSTATWLPRSLPTAFAPRCKPVEAARLDVRVPAIDDRLHLANARCHNGTPKRRTAPSLWGARPSNRGRKPTTPKRRVRSHIVWCHKKGKPRSGERRGQAIGERRCSVAAGAVGERPVFLAWRRHSLTRAEDMVAIAPSLPLADVVFT